MNSDRNVSGSELGLIICEALGISPDGVTEISIKLCAHDAATVQVTHGVRQSEAGSISKPFEMYELVRRGT